MRLAVFLAELRLGIRAAQVWSINPLNGPNEFWLAVDAHPILGAEFRDIQSQKRSLEGRNV